MRKAFTLIPVLIIVLASCSKSTTEPNSTNNIVNITAKAELAGMGTVAYWKSVVTTDKSLSDSAFVKIVYDVYNSSNVMQYSIVDTVGIPANAAGTFFHITNHSTFDNWQAKNVNVVKAWCKSGSYIFKF